MSALVGPEFELSGKAIARFSQAKAPRKRKWGAQLTPNHRFTLKRPHCVLQRSSGARYTTQERVIHESR